MVRRLLKLLVVLALLVLGLGYWGVHTLRTGPDLPSGALVLPGLEAPVEILYDSMGVPHIFADNTGDLFRAQGWVHARDRLWQMEMFRRVQDGRLSEIFGASMIGSDRFLRTIGMGKAAREGLPAEGTTIRTEMEHYAAGVNAAINGWDGPLPPEFVLLRLKPERWEARLTQGIEKIMAWDLSDYQTGLSLAEARALLGDEKLAPLMPRYPEWGPTAGPPKSMRKATSRPVARPWPVASPKRLEISAGSQAPRPSPRRDRPPSRPRRNSQPT